MITEGCGLIQCQLQELGQFCNMRTEAGYGEPGVESFRKGKLSFLFRGQLMVFPIDINKKINDKSKATAGENKIRLVAFGFFLLNLIGFYILGQVVVILLGYSSLPTVIIIMILLNAVLGTFIFRFVIFDENSKMKESKENDSDSFIRFMKIRKDVNHMVRVNDSDITIIEFSDGSACFVLELRFGSNNDVKASKTSEVINSLIKISGIFGMETRVCVMPEDITQSGEYDRHVGMVNSVEDCALRNCLVEMTDAIMKQSKKICNVNCIRLTVRAMSAFQRADLEALLKNFSNILSEDGTAFRSMKFLNIEEVLSFFCEFYGMGAIDISLMKTVELSSGLKTSGSSMAFIYSLETSDGKVYKAADIKNKIFRLEERKL